MTFEMNPEDLKHSAGWLARFAGWGFLFYLISGTTPVARLLDQYYTPLLIKVSSVLLDLIGVKHEIVRQTFVAGARNFTVSESCTGIFVFFLLCTAILSFPASWKSRFYGILAGFIVLSALNITRILMIVSIGRQFAGSFQALHVVFGQFIVIAGIAVFFILWLNTTAPNSGSFRSPGGKKLFGRAAWFVAGYGASMVFYQYFLSSAFGNFISHYIQKHAYMIIDQLAFAAGRWFSVSHFPSVVFNDGCLSSPIIVILMAIVISMPWRWRTRAIVLLVGFVPVFYGYHVIRAVLTAVSFSLGASRDTSVIYNCYGQMILAGIGLVIFWHVTFRQQNRSPGVVARKIAAGIISGGLAAVLGGQVFLKLIVPLMAVVSGWIDRDYYNDQLTISTLPYFQYFILFALIGSDRAATSVKIRPAVYGALLLLLFMTVLLAGIEILDLSPHVGILKTVIIVVPFAVYYYVKPDFQKTVE